MKKIFALLALVLIALGVFAWQLPASFLVAQLPVEASKFVQVHRVSGSVWNGRALMSVVGVAPALPLAWSCRPSVSPLGARCELREALTGAVTADLLGAAIQLERVSAVLPVQYAMGASIGASSSGVTADISAATLSQQTMAIKASLRAADATYRAGAADVALGEVNADCAPAPDARSTACTLSNRGGSGRLDGKLNLTTARATGSIELTPANGPAQRVAF
jgi:Type II secretion system (T2SS), protein N